MKHQTRRARGLDAGGWTALPPHGPRPLRLRRLLAERRSLTEALSRPGPTTVAVLRQRPGLPDADELRPMRVAAHQRRMVREVVLRVDGAPWVFAHTVANAAGRALLRRAGKRPLAAVLFADPAVRPGRLHYRRLDARHPLFARAAAWFGGPAYAAPRAFDARRALFVRGAARLLVTEVFIVDARVR